MDTREVIIAVAAELRAERAAKRISIKELSERANVPEVSLNRYLGGKRDVPSSTLVEIARALEVEPGVILDRAYLRAQSQQS